MDYKEKYEQALERARELMNKGYDVLMPEIFTELQESEDERIKYEIIAFLEQSIHCGGGTPILQEQEDKWLAWLEKQGEKKLTENAKTLNPDKVIEWLDKQACLGWLEDIEVEKVVEQFKKDFGL